MKSSSLHTLLSCLVQPGRFLYSARQNRSCRGQRNGASEDGLTLLECVVAIAVIALTGAMIGPPLVLAAATRVQNRRAEQAMQLAQGEVDRIRAMVITGEASVAKLPALVTATDLETHPAPARLMNGELKSPECNTYDPTTDVPAADEVLAVDVNGEETPGNCEADFLIQTFRQNLDRDGETRDFQLMVRVYFAKAADDFTSLQEEQASLGFTSGSGEYWQKPLAVITTRINESDSNAALCGYHGLNDETTSDGSADTDC
ncbi:MAG: type II secretion system protein [Cyanobacteria bacterium P01_F01_bin.150]